jgi:hypothetical protein
MKIIITLDDTENKYYVLEWFKYVQELTGNTSIQLTAEDDENHSQALFNYQSIEIKE